MFLFSQVMGFFGFIIFIKSIQSKEKSKVLLMQIISFLFYTIQYLLINAFSGMLVYLINVIRCLVFYLLEKKKRNTNIFCIIFLILTFFSSLLMFKNSYDVLPLLASANSVVFMWQNDTRIIRRGQIISCFLWIVYNYCVLAYVGILTEFVIIISCIFAILKYDYDIDIQEKVFIRYLKIKYNEKNINLSQKLPSKNKKILKLRIINIKKSITNNLKKLIICCII